MAFEAHMPILQPGFMTSQTVVHTRVSTSLRTTRYKYTKRRQILANLGVGASACSMSCHPWFYLHEQQPIQTVCGYNLLCMV